MLRKLNWKKITWTILFFSLLFSVIFIITRMVFAPAELKAMEEHAKVKTDYVLMLLQCSSGLLIMMIPAIIERKNSVDIPDSIEVIFYMFLFCAIYLGEVKNFYYLVPFWDTILHAFSGVMLGALGFILVRYLNESNRIHVQLSPFFVSFFAFCFAVTMGTMWEIYEFLADGILSTNMQKFIASDLTVLSGRDALKDTMMDLIVDSVSALIICFYGYLKLKKLKKQGYLR
ncbi:hypothetical protein NST62_11350 [Ureibacillus sp. FSL K6-8385]|uniref:DUF2238 domain-containing protein n=1 Tax=Ureibacillus terrenus TaxID=118246 RepID=A0A540V3A1_9BACL|nr:hypothetical protein [Ureibacillus terrenus]MED3662167.1 hypothetical protein [Ureibacillus terrenus]MED3763647.1 hypothetical protein [Ureibacillus terrenus]TQE91217.1 hypothetical protein FKZ59_06120 [Ureibacillus terrenus]